MIKVAPYSCVNYTGECQNDKYKDPLMKWPMRGLAYSNELGAALSEIAPKLGILLWFPAMLYFGADIYDKYKNEKTSYDPNAQRGTEQAIFQLLASVILPTAAVITGQKIASALGVLRKSGLSLQTQEEIINFIKEFSSRRHLNKFLDKKEIFKEHFVESLTTKRDKLIREHKIKNPLRFLYESLFNSKQHRALAMSKKDIVLDYANKNIDQMFSIFENLMEETKPNEFSNKMWQYFNKLKNKYAKDPDYKTAFLRDAAEDTIRKFQTNKMRNSKLLKTLGGFVALGLAIKPIDKFVETVIIKKYVNPNLTNIFNTTYIDKNKVSLPQS